MMKIQCNVCEVAEAKIYCCADEAALCWACDEKIHAANKLASKHQRVSLSSSSSPLPNCDICQETVGYFFCLEDRALLCRKCDVAIHKANGLVSSHQRFLLTGVKVGLEAAEPGSSSLKSVSAEKILEPDHPLLRKSSSVSTDSQYSKQFPMQLGGDSGAGSVSQWQLDEFLGLIDGNQYFNYMDNVSSKADSGKLGDSDSSTILRSYGEELDGDDYLGQVPEILSPPTASGLCWPKAYHNSSDSTFVPDISSSPLQHFYGYQPQGCSIKRRRQF